MKLNSWIVGTVVTMATVVLVAWPALAQTKGQSQATQHKEIIKQMQAWQEREGPTLGPGLTVRELREEGRRF